MSTNNQHYVLTPNIPYIPNGHPRQVLDLYLPVSDTTDVDTPSPPHPLIIYIHGGAFKMGDKVNRLLPIRFLDPGRPQRFALASVNYRLSGDAIFPAAIRDCNAAVRFLSANSGRFNLDPDRFIAMGESAGAYMACMVGIPRGTTSTSNFHHPFDNDDDKKRYDNSPGTHHSDVAGVISFYGPTDFSLMDTQAPPHAPFKHDAPDSPESLFLGHTITQVPELVKTADPATYVGDDTPPILLAHGTADVIVPFGQSVLLHKKLKEKQRDVVLHQVEGVDHVWKGITDEQERKLWSVVDEWLDRVLVLS